MSAAEDHQLLDLNFLDEEERLKIEAVLKRSYEEIKTEENRLKCVCVSISMVCRCACELLRAAVYSCVCARARVSVSVSVSVRVSVLKTPCSFSLSVFKVQFVLFDLLPRATCVVWGTYRIYFQFHSFLLFQQATGRNRCKE